MAVRDVEALITTLQALNEDEQFYREYYLARRKKAPCPLFWRPRMQM